MPELDLPVVDERTLDELMAATGDDPGFVWELVGTFLADTPAQVDAMTAAVEANDAAALVRPAHTLKSSSATVGAMRLSSVARELEMAARGGELEPRVRVTLGVAQTEWRTAAAAFAALLKRASGE
ncbi:MAG: Hpt domain-containing protein [Chloroflexi bacterium]|nr:Hpt domain-containing protein [Chloroflexota bacterium]